MKRRGAAAKTLILIILPVLLIGGVAGAGFMGVINIPGLTPKKAAKAAKLYTEGQDGKSNKTAKSAMTKPTPPPKPKAKPVASAPEPNVEEGAKRIAKLWAQIDTPKLLEMVADWKDPDLARVISYLDSAKAAELLAAMDPKRASRLSREILQHAATAKPPG